MEIYGEKGARILSLFCKFKLEKETNQHYQDKTVNSGTKKREENHHRGFDPGSRALSNKQKSQAVKSLRHRNHCFRGLMESSIAENFKAPYLGGFFSAGINF